MLNYERHTPAPNPNGPKLNYIQKIPKVLQAMPLVNSNGKFTLTFKVPDVTGDYPCIGTFPGHWRV